VRDVFFLICDGLKGLPDAVGNVWPLTTVQTSSADTRQRRDGPDADLSLLAEAGRVVPSGSSASSAVMRFQAGQPDGDLLGGKVPVLDSSEVASADAEGVASGWTGGTGGRRETVVPPDR
jgi:hypothetical protein